MNNINKTKTKKQKNSGQTYLKIAISRLMRRILATRRYPAMIIDTTTSMWLLSWFFVLKIVSPDEKKNKKKIVESNLGHFFD